MNLSRPIAAPDELFIVFKFVKVTLFFRLQSNIFFICKQADVFSLLPFTISIPFI